MQQLRTEDRLIVALDVPTAQDAMALVEKLDNVSFFKVGWQLFMSGEWRTVIEQLNAKKVFVDLKIPGDIGNTIGTVVEWCTSKGVKFLTLSESVPPATIAAAKKARGARSEPNLLTVPLLSSLDGADVRAMTGSDDLNGYILARARVAIGAGCDGLIASGDAIRVLRAEFPRPTLIVSPGIRPTWASTDDHKRHTTPTEAIELGADYIVVGRPITRDRDPRAAAQRVLDEIEEAVGDSHSASAIQEYAHP